MAKVQQTKHVVLFLVELAEGIKKAAEDGKFSVGDLFDFVPAIRQLPAALDKIDQVPTELSDLDDEEVAEIVQLVKDELDLGSEEAEAIAKAAIATAFHLLTLIYAIGEAR